ncbi:unnamed protein product [Schistosoma turkestanicum]|nr:unnamed protein product [Schistosoma turkestanicum]
MFEELSIGDLSDIYTDNNTRKWPSSNDRNRISGYRESYCSDVDLLPSLCTKVTVDIHPDYRDNSEYIQKHCKQSRNTNGVKTKAANNTSGNDNRSDDDDADTDADDDGGENLMSWLLKQFRENGLDYNENNLKNDHFDKIDEFNYVERLNHHRTSTVPNNLQLDDSNSSISSYQATVDLNKLNTRNEHLLNNNNNSNNHNQTNNSSREYYWNKQYHHFPRMYPPVRDSSLESRKLCGENKSLNSTMVTTPTTATANRAMESMNSTMQRTINDTKHQCKLINSLFHQITKKLTGLHEFDKQVINELQNASRIINDLQKAVKYSESSLLNSLNYQLNHHFCRPKIFKSEFNKTTDSLRKKTGVKHFPKKNIHNLDENFDRPITDEQHSHSVYNSELDCQSPVEKDDLKGTFLSGALTKTSGGRLTQRKFTESPWGQVSVQQANNLSKNFDQSSKIVGQNNNNIKNNDKHSIKSGNYSQWLRSSKSSVSNNTLDKLNESIYQTSDITNVKSNLSNERYFSQLTLPVYSTLSNTKSHAFHLNTSGEFNVSESTSNKFASIKGIQSLFKIPFKRKASTPGPNVQCVGHPLKSHGRSASLAQLHTSSENPPIISVSNDQLHKSTNKLNVPYIKPLLLKESSKF